MIETTLSQLETRVKNSGSISAGQKTELLKLLSTLKSEVLELSKTKAEHAESISGFIERSTHEATRNEKNPSLLKHAIDGLQMSVKEFELTHPKLVEDVNYVSTVLANMGI
ncbi:MAG: DUF4404 family protein [bacterium]